MDRQPAPALLPILRSQQQGEILTLLLGDPDLELSLTEIAARTGAPHPSVYREIQRAEQAGLVTSRKVGNTRLVRANTASPYYSGLAEILTRAFGVPPSWPKPCATSTGSPQPTSTDPGPPGTRDNPASGQ
jgi:DNA-binding transcriptional ArsR family regulator